MSNNSEKIEKEILRMLKLSGYRNVSNPIKTESKENNKKLLKEDFIDDLNDAFNSDDDFADLNTNGTKVPLTPEMKLGMVSLSINEFERGVLDIYHTYNPKFYTKKIPGAKEDDDTTIYNKKMSFKPTGGAEDDMKRWKETQKQQFPKNNPKNLENPEKAIEDLDKTIRLASVFIDPNFTEEDLKKLTNKEKGVLQKMWGKKSISMISYTGNKLTPLGKSQIEFLARAATLQPGDSFEQKLFDLPSKAVYRENARHVLREFYTLASIPIINNLLHRSKINYDNQIKEWIESGINKVMDQMDTKYNHERANFGAWALQVIKNTVINELRNVSKHVLLNSNELYEILSNSPLPIKIQSTANPKETEGEWDRFIIIKSPDRINYPSGISNSDNKEKEGKEIYEYIYTNPDKAFSDLTKDARKDGGKPSPLSPRFLTGISKARLMHAVHPALISKPIDNDLSINSENPYETEAIFQVETLPQEAKSTIYEILNQIGDVIISDVGKHSKGDEDYGADYGYVSKNVVPLLKNNKQTFIELMYDLLSFGDMVETYTKTWVIQNSKGGTTKRQPGDPVVYETDSEGNKKPIPNINGELPEGENVTMVWSSGSLSEEEVKKNFLEKFLARVQEKQGTDSREVELLNIFQSNPKEANAIISAIRGGLRKFFGFEGLSVPVLQKNRNKLNSIIKNYSTSMLAEHKARKIIKNLLLNYINKIKK